MRYTIAKEQEVKKMCEDGRTLEYISSVTGLPQKVIWQWCPTLRPHEDIIKQSVKQRYHYFYPELEAKVSAAFSPLTRDDVTEDEWEEANKVIYDTLFEMSLYVFKNVITDPPTFGDSKKLSNKKFVEYLKEFWDYDNSPYIKEHNAEKERISRQYAEICKNTIHYWSFLKNKLMRDVSKGDIEILHEKLSSKNLSPNRIYFILKVGLTPLEYAYKEGLTLLRTFDYQLPKREKKKYVKIDSVLISKIFNYDWNDQEAYLANLLGYYGDITASDVSKITLGDIDLDGNIKVGKKSITIPKKLIDIILAYSSTSPYKDYKPTDYLFYSFNRNKPCYPYRWVRVLRSVASNFTDEQVNFSLSK